MARADPAASRVLAEAVSGERIGAEEALLLLERADFMELGEAAGEVRRRRHGWFATFMVDRNINYTNVCVTACRFCAFYRPPSSPEAWTLSHDEVVRRVGEAVSMGATQVMIQGGHHPELRIEWYEELFSRVKAAYPQVTIHSLGPSEVVHISRISGLEVEETLRRLKQAGLDSLPGSGAEILVDRVRKLVSPLKESAGKWLEVMERAHSLGIRTTATMMMGHLETPGERVEHLARVREVQDRTGGFRAFIPWTYQPVRVLGGRKASGLSYLRLVATARLFLDNFEHIQGSWLTTGKDVGQASLHFGADDLGSVMLEENVVRAAGAGERSSVEELVRLIREAGFRPAQRDTEYRKIRVF